MYIYIYIQHMSDRISKKMSSVSSARRRTWSLPGTGTGLPYEPGIGMAGGHQPVEGVDIMDYSTMVVDIYG